MMQERGKSGASQKPPEPMCPMCGSPMAKSPIGVAAHRSLEGTLKQMHAQARQRMTQAKGARRY